MRIVLGIVSGFLLGLGIALLLFSYAKIAFGTDTGIVLALIGAGVGLVLGILGSRVRRSSRPATAPET